MRSSSPRFNYAQPTVALRQQLVAMHPLLLGLLLFLYTWLGPQRDFPPFALLFGLGSLVCIGVWWIWKVRVGTGLARSPFAYPLLMIGGVSALATVGSIDQRLSLEGALGVIALIVLFYIICDLLLVGWPIAAGVNTVLVLAVCIVGQGLLAVGGWFWSWYALAVPGYPLFPLPFRIFNVADQPNLLAGCIYLTAPLFILRLVDAKHWPARIGYGLWLVGAEIVLFYTRSRGGWVATAVVVALMASWLLRSSNVRHRVEVVIGVAAALALFAALLGSDATATGGAVTSNAGAGHRTYALGLALRTALDHQLLGSGPLTFGRLYVEDAGTSRRWIDPHAHNIYLDTLAQQGLVGLLALGWAVVAGLRLFASAWARTLPWQLTQEQPNDGLLIAISTGLAGYLVHGLIDVPTFLPTVGLLLVLYCALGARAAVTLAPGVKGLHRGMLAALLLPIALGGVLWYHNQGREGLLNGIVAAARGDWRGAATALDGAAAADPQFGYYWSQRAFAHGMLAEAGGSDAVGARGIAISSYEQAIVLEPRYAPNLLNYNAVRGEVSGSGQIMAAAVAHGSDWPLASLLLAQRREAEGDIPGSSALYVAALAEWGRLADSPLCRSSARCLAIAKQRAETVPFAAERERAEELLAQGLPHEALATLAAVPSTTPASGIWLLRARAHLAQGQIPEAHYALRVAALTQSEATADLALATAEVQLTLGDQVAAIAALERVARPQVDEQLYSYSVYRRIGLPGTFLPSLDRLARTGNDLLVYRKLQTLYTTAGRHNDAAWARGEAEALEGLLSGTSDE